MSAQPPWKVLEQSLEGELSLQEQERENHAADASMFYEKPAAVVFPKHRRDCETVLAFCREHNVPIHAWGAGTSRGGQPLGAGLVVNFRRHMNKILSFSETTGELTVEPGAYYAEVQKFLRGKGRSFPPDPSYHQCTIAGMIANNAAGIHSVKYGGTGKHVAALQFLTGDGHFHDSDERDELAEKAEAFLHKHKRTIAGGYPKVEKNSSGYNLPLALDAAGRIDLPKLLSGSEGTLGLISQARLRSVPLPKATALAILYFPALEAALSAAMDLRRWDVAACELVDKVLLDLHAAHGGPESRHAKKIAANKFLDRFYSLQSEALLIVEMEGNSEGEAKSKLGEALESFLPRPLEAHPAASTEECGLIWDLRRHTSPILNRLENGKITIKPLWEVEDVSLPPATFLEYIAEQKKIFARHGLTCSFFGHAASCNLHIDPLAVDPRQARLDADLARLYDEVARESFELVVRMGGAISGEHGDGLGRTPYLPLQYPECYPLFAPLKAMFDPCGILNPGKIVITEA